MKKLLIIDDHEVVRDGVKRIFDEPRGAMIFGEASTIPEALRLVREQDWDAVVLDLSLGGRGGLELLKELRQIRPKLPVVILSMHSEETLVRQAMDAGARGYLLKSAMDLELPAAVRKVAAGETVFDPQVEQRSALKGEPSAALTQRELEVLQMIVEGKSNKEIATVLDLSPNTVAVHRANIMNSLGIHKTAELVVYAIRAGLVNVP